MDSNEELEQLKKKLRENSLGISRLPKETKLEFQKIAVKYCDDYGLTLAFILEEYLEYQEMKKVMNVIYDLQFRVGNLEKFLEEEFDKKENKTEQKEDQKKIINMISGKKIEIGGKENGKI